MSNLETAIRKALEKGGPGVDPAQRARVYQSARNALENSFRNQNITDPAVIAEQRRILEAAIHDIERDMRLEFTALQIAREKAERAEEARLRSEYDAMDRARASRAASERREPPAPDMPPPATVQPTPVQPPPSQPVAPRVEPSLHQEEAPVRREEFPEVRAERPASRPVEPSPMDFVPKPVSHYADEEEDDAGLYTSAHPEMAEPEEEAAAERIDRAPERAIKPRRVRRWKAKAFAFITLLAFAGAAWWWVESTGLLIPQAQRDGSVPNPPPAVADEDFDGAKQLKSLSRQGGYGDEWTLLFEPGRTKDAAVGPAATVSVKNSGNGPYLDFASTATGPEGAVTVDIPRDVLAKMQGKTSSIAVTLQGGEKPVQVAIECDFGGLGNCGRHRFLLSQNRSDLLFEVDVKADGSPNGDGKLVINPDAGGEASEARLYSIHIQPGG